MIGFPQTLFIIRVLLKEKSVSDPTTIYPLSEVALALHKNPGYRYSFEYIYSILHREFD